MRQPVDYLAALALDAIGAGGALLVATRDWQTVVAPRARPFIAVVVPIPGRAIDAAPTALALVALAGVVAVLATRGIIRQLIGVLIAAAGVGLIWRTAASIPAVGATRARELVRARRVSVSRLGFPDVTTHLIWGVSSIVCGVLVLVGGALVAVRGGRWRAMSTRYETPAPASDPESAQSERQRADAALWGALDRGEDPTARDPSTTD